jgi:uncharacterized membrane protein YhhN
VTALLYLCTVVVAIGDWLAVRGRYYHLEYLLKPTTLVLLIWSAASSDLPGTKPWVLAALVLSLVGDIALMLSPDRVGRMEPLFLGGLATFLVAHICYIAAFAAYGVHGGYIAVGTVIAALVAAIALPRIVTAARRIGGMPLTLTVIGYALVLGVMVAFAVGTTAELTAVGGVLFLASDTVLAWGRLVRPVPGGPVTVAVTYHFAQLCLVLGLLA